MPSATRCKKRLLLFIGPLLAALAVDDRGEGPSRQAAVLDVPPMNSIKRVDRQDQLTPKELQSRMFILKTESHPTNGDAYVIVTDHRDDGYWQSLQRLAKHRQGTVIRVDDLAQLPRDAHIREDLRAQLCVAQPRFVAIVPRSSSYSENMLLAMWEILSTLDSDPQLDVFPGILLAPNDAAFSALIDHSINHKPQAGSDVRPYVVGQVMDETSIMGQRSLQKVNLIRNVFDQYGYTTPSLVVRTFRGRPSGKSDPAPQQQWSVSMAGPRQSVTELPAPAKQALDQSSLLLMFGHGVPGMTCSLDVSLFRNVTMANKVVLCGSCFSAAPRDSDFPAMLPAPGGSELRIDRERFVMRAVENGAVVVYGHMRENSGFPQMYPVLEALMDGLTVGEAFQRLINAIIDMNSFAAGHFILTSEAADSQRAVTRRNILLYVIIGDPALIPLAPLAKLD
jgi:hypothetical protein